MQCKKLQFVFLPDFQVFLSWLTASTICWYLVESSFYLCSVSSVSKQNISTLMFNDWGVLFINSDSFYFSKHTFGDCDENYLLTFQINLHHIKKIRHFTRGDPTFSNRSMSWFRSTTSYTRGLCVWSCFCYTVRTFLFCGDIESGTTTSKSILGSKIRF